MLMDWALNNALQTSYMYVLWYILKKLPTDTVYAWLFLKRLLPYEKMTISITFPKSNLSVWVQRQVVSVQVSGPHGVVASGPGYVCSKKKQKRIWSIICNWMYFKLYLRWNNTSSPNGWPLIETAFRFYLKDFIDSKM